MKSYLRWLSNRYILTFIISIIWMVFFDQYDLRSQYELRQKIKQMEEDKQYYQEQIKIINEEKELLLNDPGALEKFAREQYFMKRDEEDLFIIVPSPSQRAGAISNQFLESNEKNKN
ncbi:MAG: septum formation initiator family protein [Bacteroidia bacterium]|nr:septum formation initiator family protein [Bacteroidia bacterium]MDW8157927.1 septum formation initiator family protein [Bacteroidia bacterium]